MFKNYLKITFRNIVKHKGHSLINILGLAIGMACCILILLYVGYELSFDRYHENTNNIYRLGIDATMGGRNLKVPFANVPVTPAMINEFPEVVNAVRLDDESKIIASFGDRQFYEDNVFYADNSIFEVFSFPLLKGDERNALKAPFTIVLTEQTARKYFGDDEPIGKIITFDNKDDYRVTGVMKNVPSNSHFTFDMLCSFETQIKKDPAIAETWMNFSCFAYLLFENNCDIEKFKQKLPSFVDAHMGEVISSIGGTLIYVIEPLADIHLHSTMDIETPGSSDIRYIYVFTIIAVSILLIAYINFINLITARSTLRAKEIGIRKTMGASKYMLAKQFIGESITYSFLALIISLIIVELLLPVFGSISDCDVSLNNSNIIWLLPALILSAIFLGLIAGIYPAFHLSSYRPVTALKGGLLTGTAKSRLRGALVVGQFAISIALIAGTIIIFSQLQFMKNKSLGFNKNRVLIIGDKGLEDFESSDVIREKLLSIDGVVNVATASEIPGEFLSVSVYIPEGFSEDESEMMSTIYVDHDFIPTLEMELAEGRNFLPNSRKDMEESALINEAAVRKFGWESGLGKTIKVSGDGDEMDTWEERNIIGVIKDYHMISLHKAIEPLYIDYSNNDFDRVMVKIKLGDISGTVGKIEKIWQDIMPDKPFDYYFLDQRFDVQYRKEERLSAILLYFTSLAIFIACLGLYGMSSFTIEQRTKEIGIRKVLGASITGIAGLMTRNFLMLVVISNIIAWPVAYFAVKRWLENFAYRVKLNIVMFLIAGAIALIVALITISSQAIKAAQANPVDTLRHE